MLGDLFQADTDRALDDLAAKPPIPPKPESKWNGWSAPLRAVAAGAAQVGASVADMSQGYGQIMSASGASAGGMFSTQSEAERRDSELQRFKMETQGVDTTSEFGTALREVDRHYRPDPATASFAERMVFDVTRFLTKAVGYSVLGAGVPGAVALGADEAMVTADDLARQGVDPATRMKAGAVAGVAAAAGVLLPVAAPGSVAKTVGLWALGGPGAFVAQQQATREILGQADYKQLAEQYDPLDPVGLLVSSLVPAGFAAHALHGARVKAAPGAKPAPEAPPTAPTLTPEQLDAVMTHNLTLARDVHEATGAVMQQASDALDLAKRNNTFEGQAPGAGRQVGMTQPKGTPADKLFSNFADQMRDTPGGTTRDQKIADFRGSMFDRANSEPQQFKNDPLKTGDIQLAGDMVARIDAANSGTTRVQVIEGGEVIGAARIKNGMIDSIAVSDAAKGRGIGADMLRFLDSQGIANIHEVPDRSPGFVKIQKAVIGEQQQAPRPTAMADQKPEAAGPTLTADHLTNTPAAPPKPSADPLLASIAERIARVEQAAPDMVVGHDSEGKPLTVRSEMERIRNETAKGTDDSLGADDAPLLQVAANCALSAGAA